MCAALFQNGNLMQCMPLYFRPVSCTKVCWGLFMASNLMQCVLLLIGLRSRQSDTCHWEWGACMRLICQHPASLYHRLMDENTTHTATPTHCVKNDCSNVCETQWYCNKHFHLNTTTLISTVNQQCLLTSRYFEILQWNHKNKGNVEA